ncbi:MAG: hypothetical protein V3U95_01615 [Dehalococcoidia bacterium]
MKIEQDFFHASCTGAPYIRPGSPCGSLRPRGRTGRRHSHFGATGRTTYHGSRHSHRCSGGACCYRLRAHTHTRTNLSSNAHRDAHRDADHSIHHGTDRGTHA